MAATIPQIEQSRFTGYMVNYYPARLSEWELEAILPLCAKHCREGEDPSTLLAAYLHAVVSFELERRRAIEDGNEVLEVLMPEVPCQAWSGEELAKAMGKIISLTIMNHGEVQNMLRHILNCILAETQLRLGLK